MQAPVRTRASHNGPAPIASESFLAQPTHAVWAAGGMLALVVLIAILVEAGPLVVDRSWSESMHHLETPLLTDLALAFNGLGRGLGRAVGLMLVGVLLLRRRRWLALAAFAVAESLAPLLSVLLKALIDRPRPPEGIVHAAGSSFPSGRGRVYSLEFQRESVSAARYCRFQSAGRVRSDALWTTLSPVEIGT